MLDTHLEEGRISVRKIAHVIIVRTLVDMTTSIVSMSNGTA